MIRNQFLVKEISNIIRLLDGEHIHTVKIELENLKNLVDWDDPDDELPEIEWNYCEACGSRLYFDRYGTGECPKCMMVYDYS